MNLSDWHAGDPLKASHWQEAINALRDLDKRTPHSLGPYNTITPLVPVVVRVDEVATGGGKYYGVLMQGNMDGDSSTDLALPEGMTADTTTALECLVYDVPEDGETTHRITIGKHLQGYVVGFSEAEGLPVVLVNWGRKSWKTRWNSQDKRLEQASNWEDDSPSWETIVAFDSCDGAVGVDSAIGGVAGTNSMALRLASNPATLTAFGGPL